MTRFHATSRMATAQTERERHLKSVIDGAMSLYARSFQEFAKAIRDSSRHGVSPAQYQLYRDNYLYRTSTTFPCLIKILAAAEHRPHVDAQALDWIRQTIFEEAGSDGDTPSHFEMLLDSHNIHGNDIFNIPPIERHEIDNSSFLIKEAVSFREIQSNLYNSSYECMVGAFYAQESAAESMLELFFESLFRPYRVIYKDRARNFDSVERYFSAHLNGIEREHAERARACAFRACDSEDAVEEFRRGMFNLLEAQNALWRGIDREWKMREN